MPGDYPVPDGGQCQGDELQSPGPLMIEKHRHNDGEKHLRLDDQGRHTCGDVMLHRPEEQTELPRSHQKADTRHRPPGYAGSANKK